MDYALWVVNLLYPIFPSTPSNNQLDGFWSMDDNSLAFPCCRFRSFPRWLSKHVKQPSLSSLRAHRSPSPGLVKPIRLTDQISEVIKNKIFVGELEQAIRIRTQEVDADAL